MAALVIAKLDRLARNVTFIANLMESSHEFVACDMPNANRLPLHIVAAVAEYECERISTRTKDALAAAKQRGIRLGNLRSAASAARGRQTIAALLAAHRQLVQPIVVQLRTAGYSLRAITGELNHRCIPSVHGRQ
jgi:DNA invertase Pin-like site-specific DNA recombinase